MRRQFIARNRRMMLVRFSALILGCLALAACVSDDVAPKPEPSFYIDLARPGAQLDAAAAASMISGYRANNNLPAVTLDPELTRFAAAQGQHAAQGRHPHRHRRGLYAGLQIQGLLVADPGGAGRQEGLSFLSFPRRRGPSTPWACDSISFNCDYCHARLRGHDSKFLDLRLCAD